VTPPNAGTVPGPGRTIDQHPAEHPVDVRRATTPTARRLRGKTTTTLPPGTSNGAGGGTHGIVRCARSAVASPASQGIPAEVLRATSSPSFGRCRRRRAGRVRLLPLAASTGRGIPGPPPPAPLPAPGGVVVVGPDWRSVPCGRTTRSSWLLIGVVGLRRRVPPAGAARQVALHRVFSASGFGHSDQIVMKSSSGQAASPGTCSSPAASAAALWAAPP